VTNETYDRYMRFLLMKADSNYRECSACLTPLQLPAQQTTQDAKKKSNTNSNSSSSNILQCSTCGLKSCFLHGDAHPSESCVQYVSRMAKNERDSLEQIKRIAKKCPGCQCDTEKNLGCNHMVSLTGEMVASCAELNYTLISLADV